MKGLTKFNSTITRHSGWQQWPFLSLLEFIIYRWNKCWKVSWIWLQNRCQKETIFMDNKIIFLLFYNCSWGYMKKCLYTTAESSTQPLSCKIWKSTLLLHQWDMDEIYFLSCHGHTIDLSAYLHQISCIQ